MTLTRTRARRQLAGLSLAEARGIAIAAQGFGVGRQDVTASKAELKQLVERLGVVQIDSVNVLARAHTLPAFSRLGCYERDDLHALTYNGKRRALFEYWGHAASLLPVELYPMFRWRMERASQGIGIYGGLAKFGRERQALIEEVRREIADRGPLAAGELTHQHKGAGGWWGWSDGKTALEWLFWSGEVTTATRRPTFERLYDLTERVLPQSIVAKPTPSTDEAHRVLVERSALALGVASEVCLRDYYRLGSVETKRAILELVEAGRLVTVEVEGWERPAYLHRSVRGQTNGSARALLAPFDPLIWHRSRVEALFGVRIRLELYTPQEKRLHGYYVLPFLLGDRLVARVDLKADREASILQVLAAHREVPNIVLGDFIEPLAEELRLMAKWLGMEKIAVGRRGDAGAALKTELAQQKHG
jgi:uncharacterized protein YcaQ